MAAKRSLMPILLLAASLSYARGQIVISELMQSNIDCVMDDLNEYPDSWVELRNGGSSSVQLSKYCLGLTDDAAKAWRLPGQTLQPGACVPVYCDKNAQGLHTDF